MPMAGVVERVDLTLYPLVMVKLWTRQENMENRDERYLGKLSLDAGTSENCVCESFYHT